MENEGARRWDPRLEGVHGQPLHDPRKVLRELLELQQRGANAGWLADPEKRRLLALRRGEHKPIRELRDGCIFACLIEQVPGVKMRVASVKYQNNDADVVLFWKGTAGEERFCPVQLKELVPEDLNPEATIDGILRDQAGKPETDTALAVYMNRRARIEEITVPAGLPFGGGVWLFGGSSPDGAEWVLIGNLMGESETRRLSLGL